MEMAITAWLGIDIAKQKFDVALNWNSRRRAKVFRNDVEGWQALLRWLKDLGVDLVHACLEATGRYGDGLALHLHDAGHRVSIVNPAQIKHFGRAKVPGAKVRAGMRLSEVASALCGPDLFQACRFQRRSPFRACRVATLRP